MTALFDKRRGNGVICLNLCKAFDTVQHDILVSKLQRHGFDGWTTWWIRNVLDDYTSKNCGEWLHVQAESVMSSIPQGLVLRKLGFNFSVGDGDSGVEGTLSKFADDIKVCGVVDTQERWNVIQRDLDRVER
ncbi:rna-directed dna polymerase from mobile element jockey-like [Willisornis vidua]|uniref:Rna-directed dna polymerase from mobile element jockey-like n=1 Tax=Willisornis vidua TaxID=1566151 RepID=A0ABQ9DBQ4_9PASS|nr:rna-directed dna polymerase from mobile element jockey-like [Willisornis vidua]